MSNPDLMEKIVSLAKRRGFVFPGSEIYGGLANSWDYGPLGTELKNNIKQLWWKRFVQQRDDMVGIDAALVMNPKVWEASGHLATFTDPLVECKKCHYRFRPDQEVSGFAIQSAGPEDSEAISYSFDLLEKHKCSSCGEIGKFTVPQKFNLMMKTFIGPIDPVDSLWQAYQRGSNTDDMTRVLLEVHDATAYFRPETAQAMFVQFKNVLDTSRKQVPFGIAQIGKAFRNEITPGNFIFRTREFEQMEIEYFIPKPQSDEDWNKYFETWKEEMIKWMRDDLGLDMAHVHELEVPEDERAHYSKRTIDFEYEFPFGTKELYGLAYRGDFDLSNHQKASGSSLEYLDPQTNEKYLPHVIEPTWGVDRSFLAVLAEHYREEGDADSKRVYLALPMKLAPYKAAVFPLLKNKPELVGKAREIYDDLRKNFSVAWDDRGNVGKRYYSQDEIGTPYGITVDFQTLEDNTVTIRDRDTMQQERISVGELQSKISNSLL
jgi:glycyl-tRNA synthetase